MAQGLKSCILRESNKHTQKMEFDTDIWSEINDAPGELFDIPEMKEFDGDDTKSLEDFLQTNNDF